MKLEVGMYVRTKDGFIDKVINDYKGCCNSPNCNCKHVSCEHNYYDEENIIKVSDNLIDLIDAGDYVNGERVIALRKDIPERDIHMNSKDNFIFVEYDLANNWYYGIDTDKIKTVVTKEQFESMAYEVE